jgi:dCTP deaminase
MLLSNRDILEEARFDNIVIQPYKAELLQPASYDVTLSPEFQSQLEIIDDGQAFIDPKQDTSQYFNNIYVPKESGFLLGPGAFALGSTHEVISLGANIAARCEGKSSLGRLGLQVHCTAGFIDPGFEGTVTFEFSNVGTMPIVLWPGMKIGQLCFFKLPNPSTILYGSRTAGSHYQYQAGPTTSRSHESFKVYDVYPEVDTVESTD